MNVALILAAGKSVRMKSDYPKQFLEIFKKPVIMYTLETFQLHPEIDAILVVCLDGWHEKLKQMAEASNITKLKWIVSGGETGQESVKLGTIELEKHCQPQDIVVLHDANRPLVSAEIISDCIAVCRKHGTGISSIPVTAAIGITDDKISTNNCLQWNKMGLMTMVKPEAYTMEKMVWAYQEADRRGITDSITYSTMFIDLGESVYFALGSEKNVKITRPDDIEIFKALLIASKQVSLADINDD